MEISDPPSASLSKTSKERNILSFIIFVGIFMFVIDGSVVSIALPTITRYFQADVSESQWVITSYLVTVTSLLMIFGKLAEWTGKVRLFLLGFVLFTLASVACGLSSSLEMLIVFRATQAIGAAMAFSISAAVIFEIYPRGEQGKAMGYIGTTVSLASIAGPMMGGYLVDYLGWQYIFLINLPIGIFLLALASKYMKMEEAKSHKLELDWQGGSLLVIFLVSFMLLLTELASGVNFTSKKASYALLAVGSLLAFIWIELHQEAPLLDLGIFRIKKFVFPVISIILFIISSFAVFILGPFYFQGVMGFSPAKVGTVFLIVPAIMAFGSPLGGWFYDQISLSIQLRPGSGNNCCIADINKQRNTPGGLKYDTYILWCLGDRKCPLPEPYQHRDNDGSTPRIARYRLQPLLCSEKYGNGPWRLSIHHPALDTVEPGRLLWAGAERQPGASLNDYQQCDNGSCRFVLIGNRNCSAQE